MSILRFYLKSEFENYSSKPKRTSKEKYKQFKYFVDWVDKLSKLFN